MKINLDFYKPTNDNWYPSYAGKFVRVNIHLFYTVPGSKPIHRFSLWGNDDFGLEWETYSLHEALAQLTTLVKQEVIDVKFAESLGFTRF